MSEAKRILVADDEKAVLETIELVLMADGYEVITASDGEMCLSLAKRHLPDGIILDVGMPKMNGYLCANLMSQDELIKDIPIVLLTGMAQMAGGIMLNVPNVFRKLSKPFDYEQLLKVVGEMTTGSE